jgi:ATP-binding cassette subfamily F protein 3
MLLKPLNLLILDEPTNHLDLHSKDILLDALCKFNGTVIFVSHDRYFMEALSTKTLELTPGSGSDPSISRLFYGNYSYYLDRKKSEEKQPTPEKSSDLNKNERKIDLNEKRLIDKQKNTQKRRLEKREVEILKTLEELEKTKCALEAELSMPHIYSNTEKAREVKIKIDECTASIEKKTAEWEEAVKELQMTNE